MKSRGEVENLKKQWMRDPCWDIENTEGFEEYKQELLACHKQADRKWEKLQKTERKKYARKMGTGNVKLAEYIESLEKRIVDLELKTES
jgi:hypothetical protein